MNHTLSGRQCSATLVLLALVAIPCEGAELAYAMNAGASYSDNIELQPKGEEVSASAAVLGLMLQGERPAGRLRYGISTDLSYYEYLDGDADSGLQGRGSLTGLYQLRPETLHWNVGLGYEQLRADMARPLAPGNLEDRLSVSTGPSLRLPLGGAMHSELDGQYARVSYGDQPFDNETWSGSVLLARRANPNSLLGIGASYSDVRYVSDPVFSIWDFERKEVFARLQLQGVRTELEIEGGYSEAKGASIDDGGALARLNLNRKLTPALTAYFTAVREYPTSDIASDLGGRVESGFVDSGQVSAGPRLMTVGTAGLGFERTRVSADLSYSRVKEETFTFDAPSGARKFSEIRGSLSRRFTPNSQGSLYGVFSNEEFGGTNEGTRETTLGATAGMSFGRGYGVNFRIERRGREANALLGSISELGGSISLTYSGQAGGGPPAN